MLATASLETSPAAPELTLKDPGGQRVPRAECCGRKNVVLIAEAGHSGRTVFVVDPQGKVAYSDASPAFVGMARIPSNDRVPAVLAGPE
jgi:peroxiredoxin